MIVQTQRGTVAAGQEQALAACGLIVLLNVLAMTLGVGLLGWLAGAAYGAALLGLLGAAQWAAFGAMFGGGTVV
ncbi:hypothetical protein ABZ215_22690, partial [Amycolatopsis sp. NPDC006131]